MSRCRVVDPKTIRLPLSDGDFLDVKEELNAGEYTQLIRDMADRKTFTKILAYTIGWSLLGLDGTPLPYSLELDEETRRATVGALDKASFRELTATLDRHEAAQDAIRDAKKKTPATAPASSPPSTSVAP